MKQKYNAVNRKLEYLSGVFALHACITSQIPRNHLLRVDSKTLALTPLATQSTLNRKPNEN
ncbi:MAG: hypothetical protein AB8B48_14725 [Pseudomonadales bacterium]